MPEAYPPSPEKSRSGIGALESERLRALFENALDAVVGMDSSGKITDWNEQAEIQFGWSRKEAIGRKMSETLIPERYRSAHETGLRRFLETGEGPILNRRIEVTALHRSGAEFSVELTVTPVRTDDSWSFYSFLRDISERKRSEKKLHESLAILNGLIEGTSDAVFVKDREGRYRHINSAGAAHIGRKPSEIIGKSDAELLPVQIARKIMEDDAEVIRSEREHRFEEEVVVGDRTKVFFSNKSPFRDERGKVVGMIGIARDVTESKTTENLLRLSERRFRSLFEQAPLGIQIVSPDGAVLEVNEAWREIWRVSREEVDRHVLKDYSVLEDPQLKAKGILPYVKKAFEGQVVRIPPAFYDPSEIGKPGRPRWIETVIYPIGNAGEPSGEFVFFHNDVTKKAQAERVLKILAESSALIATSLDQKMTLDRIARLAIESFEGWCMIHLCAEKGELRLAVVDHKRAEMAEELRILNLKFPLPPESLSGPARVAKTGVPELITKLEPGQYSPFRPLQVRSSVSVPLRARNETLGVLTLLSSDRRYYAEDLELAEELARRAALAIQNANFYDQAQRAVQMRDEFLLVASHELKTPLTPLSVQLQNLQRLSEKGRLGTLPAERIRNMISPALRQFRNLERLIEDLLDVSRISAGRFELKKETVDLASLVAEAVERFVPQLKEAGCSLELKVPERVVGNWDSLRIDEVVVNLLSNAIKYGAGEPIEVEVGSRGDRAFVRVRDHGIGIRGEDQAQIFDRFARAVSPYRYGGLGLGLFIAREIVLAHGGTIRVESEEGKGSTFTVELPRLSPAPSERS